MGRHPKDEALFAPDALPALRAACADLTVLLTRGYARPSSMKLVGDRYELTARQRVAVGRCACGDRELEGRREREVDPRGAAGRELLVDGFNVLTTIEAALRGGVLLIARDGCMRDLASVHGNYRVLEDTRAAARLVTDELERLAPREVSWLLDRPVSNSGRLKELLEELTGSSRLAGAVSLVADPDPLLAQARGADQLVATADSGILDACGQWINLARRVVERSVPDAWVVDLGGGDE